ncbi:UNVERIFIED_CONTAM: Serine/threonine-protein phosphatase 4 regulatory subunitA [Sesamum angustifolium]|uniref:Serine/threonine-protein phosphatase 4 regulatory subunitA n=1 Tax=Sesamum angustifolium TaxID=2727405 RepID=A0AAW2NZ96_9LAMI
MITIHIPYMSYSFCQRVKVYRLNEDGKWDDQGTGHVTVDYLERSEDLGLFVIDEEDNETLLLHRISSEDIYRKQEDTIISWRDPEFSTELALSFQETTGCSYIWDHICSLQRNMHFSTLASETFHSVNSELRELPPVELSTLPLILKIVESGIADQLRVTELILHDQVFFRKLMELFRVCEDLENLDGLHLIFKIVRGIILLNSPQIFEKMFGDELIMDVIGCLEYDPEVSHSHHRNFLKEHVVFKEAIPIKDPVVLSKIHQTYRVGYLKDVILPRALDEAIIANFNSIIHSNNAIVVSLLKDDSTFIKELFARLKSPNTSTESKKTLVHFVHEFCTLSKSLQMVHQHRLFRDLVNEGIFDVIADVLQSEDHKLVLTGTDILILFQNLDSNILRSYVARQEGVLFELLVKNMLTDFGDDMHCQFLEIIRSLLDSFTPGSQRENIVEIFYDKHLDQLIDVITSCAPNNGGQMDSKSVSSDRGSRGQSNVKPEILLNVCDLLSFCVLQHPYRIKCNFLLNNVVDKSLSIPGDLKVLLRYLVDTFWDQLVKFENLSSIHALKVKYEQLLESAGTRSTATVLDQRKRLDERALEKEEEDYFNEDSDEEDSASAHTAGSNKGQSQPSVLVNGSTTNYPSPRAGGLVDYDDDEDDEDYRPPPKKLTDVSDEDEGLAEFPLKRKLVSKEEPEPKRLHRSPKGLKPREGVFAALCSTLSEAVLPGKRVGTASLNIPPSNVNQNAVEPNLKEKGSVDSSEHSQNAETENNSDKEEVSPRSFTDGLNDSADNRKLGDDCLLPPKSSPEMAVNGS